MRNCSDSAWRLTPGVFLSPRWRASGAAVLIAALSLALSGCGREKGDPVQIARDFFASLWTQDVEQISALTCSDWRDVTTQWASETGNPAITVDTQHLSFAVISENDDQITLEMTGVVSMKAPDGQVEVRDYNELGAVRVILVDESGWKVCDLR